MAAEAVADRSGSGLTNATRTQAVVLDTELHVWLDGGPWKRIMRERNSHSQGGEGEGDGLGLGLGSKGKGEEGMKRLSVVKECPEKWSEKEDATENKKMKGVKSK